MGPVDAFRQALKKEGADVTIEEGQKAGIFSIGLIERRLLVGYSFEEYQVLTTVEK
ncbi:hypothetical protein IV487_14850 [Enterococcus saccharolyticus]|uniref:hypothetical protein n=1 Tax=Enterococcus TaxID=1350 RepID=UPI001E3940F1|nr:hypothetical protein [Enterococcus saccharolyticus]MCD5003740.1 hypothetical protein [Enterococcus saccharolyticus]